MFARKRAAVEVNSLPYPGECCLMVLLLPIAQKSEHLRVQLSMSEGREYHSGKSVNKAIINYASQYAPSSLSSLD